MSKEFAFKARQYFDFSKHEDDINDSYFESNVEEVPPTYPTPPPLYQDVTEAEDTSERDSDCFFSPMSPTESNSKIYLTSKMRKSLSMTNLAMDSPKREQPKLNIASDDTLLEVKVPRASSLHSVVMKASQEHINRLAQPKRFTSHENLTLAEAVNKFQSGTPKRFRSKPKPSPQINRMFPQPNTIPYSPKFISNLRARPVTAISKDEQEIREMEEAKKFKIKAHPVNKKVMKGPLKTQLEKKPPTMPEPFHLTEVKKKDSGKEEPKVPIFKAQPLPKSLHNPFKVQANAQPATKGQSPNFSKRLSKLTPNKQFEKPEVKSNIPEPFKPLTRTQPIPFSFERRDQHLMKKKEEFINRVLEEEKKAREFHANPLPKGVLRSRNSSHEKISETGSIKSFKRSTEELASAGFKARPATVLTMKPFEPKHDECHSVKIEAFRLLTEERLQERQKYDEKVKEKEAIAEAKKKEQEEKMKRMEEEEVAKLRKQMEVKAQPIKKYKEVIIQPSHKVTQPISPKFHTDMIRNKENIQQ